MSMSVSLHTKTAETFVVRAGIENHSWSKDYAVIGFSVKPVGSYEYQDVTIFPDFEQAKQVHKQLSKLMKEIAALEKLQKAEKQANETTKRLIAIDTETDEFPF